MTPVPCNFFRVANSDYRVGVELRDKHHLSRYCFAFAIFNPLSCSCEALFSTKSVSEARCIGSFKIPLFLIGVVFQEHPYHCSCWVLNDFCNRFGRNRLLSWNSTHFTCWAFCSLNAGGTSAFFHLQFEGILNVIQSDHPVEHAAYSNAIKPSPRGSVTQRSELQANTKEPSVKGRKAEPAEVRGLFTEQRSLIGFMLPGGVCTAHR